MIADAFDRRKLLLIVAVILLLSTTGLLALAVIESHLSAVGQHVWVWPFFVFTTVGAMAGIAIGATRSAIVQHIVSRELVAPASALNGLSIGAQFMVGPALAGVLAASVGFEWTFVVDMVLTGLFSGPVKHVRRQGMVIGRSLQV
jgi:MFS family permease